MNKVLILGCAGSGKSTFSKHLGIVQELPVIHLDSLYWKSGWVESTEAEWNFKKRSRGKILRKLEKAKEQKKVIIFKSRKDVENYIKANLTLMKGDNL